jgi:hypothetical protein
MAEIDQDQDGKPLEEVVLTRLMRLNATIHGLVFGTILGLALFIATNWLVLRGGGVVGPHLGLLDNFFIGYKVSFLGSFVGLFYGFVTGFIIGAVIALIYNWIADFREASARKN